MDSGNIFCAILMVLCGVYCIAASYFNLDFFFRSRKAVPIVKIFGRNGARIFYGALGIFLIAVSVVMLITGG